MGFTVYILRMLLHEGRRRRRGIYHVEEGTVRDMSPGREGYFACRRNAHNLIFTNTGSNPTPVNYQRWARVPVAMDLG
jgi:hypothetical protein